MPSSTSIAAASLLVAAAGAASCTYAALSAQSQIFGPVLIAPQRPREIALTFDDGPNDTATEELLEVLARYKVRATFFMIGRAVRQRPRIARAVAAAGHVIGNHSMTHPWLAWQPVSRIREELSACNRAIEDALGMPVRLFRPPHGARRPVVLRVARELNLAAVHWNVLVQDWQSDVDATAILGRLERGIRRNRRRGFASNIVLHDGDHKSLDASRLATVAATARLLELCQGSSTEFVTPVEWLPIRAVSRAT